MPRTPDSISPEYALVFDSNELGIRRSRGWGISHDETARFHHVSRQRGYRLATASHCLDAGRLNDRPPFLDLGLLVCTERLGTALLGWRNFLALVSKSLPHRWV